MPRRTGLTLALILSSIPLGAGGIGGTNSRLRPVPWIDVLEDGRGEILAASGRGEDGVPFVVTVWRSSPGERIVRSTTFVRGGTALRIERVYEPEVGLEVTYAAGGERLCILARRAAVGGFIETIWILSDGEAITLRRNPEDGTIEGNVNLLRRSLREARTLSSTMSEFEGTRSRLVPSLAEGARLFPQKTLDLDCWSGCAGGCRRQCSNYCSDIVACEVCMNSCYAGCAIGCM